MLPVGHQHPQRPRVGQGPGRRAHPRDQPAGRPLAAGLHRPRRARREHDRHRLRRAAGRRRHPHRRDHRRLRRAGRRRHLARRRGRLADRKPLSCAVAAVSVGVVDGRVRLDLPYEEDSRAEVDMNVVATDTGTLVEVQGTGEGATFPAVHAGHDAGPGAGRLRPAAALQTEALALPYPGRAARADHAAKRLRELTRSWSPAATPGSWSSCAGSSTPPDVSGLRLLASPTSPDFAEAPETGATFEENALAKARDAVAATGSARGRRRLRPRRRRAERHARRAVRAMVWRRTATTSRTLSCCWASSATCPMSGAVRRSCRRCALVRRRAETVVRGEWRAASSAHRGATTGSATTRSSCPTGRNGRLPS